MNNYKLYFFIIFFFIILFFIIFYIYYFFKNTETFTSCEYSGSPCITNNDGFGIFDNECKCIGLNPYNTRNLHFIGDEEYNLEEQIQEEEQEEEQNITSQNYISSCIPMQNFSNYCQQTYGSNYGVKNILPCNNNQVSITCDYGYIGGIKYNTDNIVTPCIDKTLDFDTMCKYYNNKSIKNGYNINSIASKKILYGKNGDCYLNNGHSDNNKARVICDNNHYNTITKLPLSTKLNNNFTDCLPTSTDFNQICQTKNSDINSYSYDIMAYDCIPGYSRSKCTNKPIDSDLNIKNILFSKYSYKI